MKQTFTLLLALFFGFGLSAQTVILDFETATTSTTYRYFGSSLDGTLNNIIANPDASGINTSATVADHVRPVGAEVFAGAFADPVQTTSFDFTNQSEVCIKVWFENPGTVSLKFENSTNGAENWRGEAQVTETQTWTEVCLDVATPSIEGPFQPVVGGQYPSAVIFFDFGLIPTEDITYYYDDIVVNGGIAALSADVTFSVDMNDFGGTFTQPYVSGTFNGWSGTANPLDDSDGDGIWEATLTVIQGGNHEYKFTFDDWVGQEEFNGTETCTVTDGGFTNRSLFVDMATMDLPTNCFNSCYACGESVDITFEVAAYHIATSGDGIFIAGGGNFGAPGDYPMNDDDMDDIWTITVEREIGFSSFYAFANGFCPDFSCKEELAGLPCGNPGNFNDRFLPPVMADTLVSTCYEQCTTNTDCAPPAEDRNVTFQVDMNNYPDPFGVVGLSGSFNNWSGDANPMTDLDGDGVWETTLLIPDGAYEYKFQLDVWTVPEEFPAGEPCTITDPSGAFTNRFIEVTEDATVCFTWNSCDGCGVVPPPTRSVTFQVDLTNYADPFTTAYISGAFNGWDGGANPLADGDGDGIWETTIDLPEGGYEYKFQLDQWTVQEEFDLGDPCTVTDPTGEFTNRIIEFTSDTTVCFVWNSCDMCGMMPPTVRSVTFGVDLSDYADPFTTAFISGSFNGWDGAANPLADDDGDGIWETTIDLPEGPYEYKFQLDEWTVQEEFVPGLPCTVTDGTFVNRFIEVASDSTVCYNWNSCSTCGMEPPSLVNITFQVDLNDYTDPFTTAFVSGSFNGWDGGANPLADPDGDGIWETTVTIAEGQYEYKFQLDEWTVQEEFASGDPCTITDPSGAFVNRFIEVDSDTTVCFEWNTCVVCDGPAPVTVLFQVDMSLYTEPYTTVYVSGTFNGWDGEANPLTDADGDLIWEATLELFPGEYEYKFQVDAWTDDEMFMDGDPCTITDPSGSFVNRYLLVEEDTELCFIWETCTECGDVSNRNLVFDANLFDVIPNLVNEFTLVKFNQHVFEEKTIRIFDATGRLVDFYEVDANSPEQKISTSEYGDGLYLVYVQAGDKMATKKIIKQ